MKPQRHCDIKVERHTSLREGDTIIPAEKLLKFKNRKLHNFRKSQKLERCTSALLSQVSIIGMHRGHCQTR